MYIIFLEKLGNYTPEIMDIILIWAVYPRCLKYLYYLIRDLLIFSLDIVIIAFNIIFFKLNFIFNTKISINVFCFYMIKDIIYPMQSPANDIIYIILNWKRFFFIKNIYLIILLFIIYYII